MDETLGLIYLEEKFLSKCGPGKPVKFYAAKKR
jgi:hypothetical protein